MGIMQRILSLFGFGKKDADNDILIGDESQEGFQILVIDDSRTVVTMLSRVLTESGHIPAGAGSAEEGMALISQEQPDLIFLDIILPGMNGFTALRRLRQDPATAHIPVIMMSGDEKAAAQFVLDRIGADDFMKKPFTPAEVNARIKQLTEKGRLTTAAARSAVKPAADEQQPASAREAVAA